MENPAPLTHSRAHIRKRAFAGVTDCKTANLAVRLLLWLWRAILFLALVMNV